MADEPALDRRRLVGRGVVEHDVHVEVRRHGGVDQVEEAAELLGAMPRRHLRDHLPGGDVEGGVEVGGAVADVVVCLPRRHPRHQRQHRRRAVERLDLRLLVDAEHDRRLGRIEVEPDDVAHLVDELRIRRELERLDLMRLERERPPDPADRALAHPGRGRHRARRPVRRVRRLLLERLHDHPLDVLVADRARLARPRLVVQPIEAAPREPAPPPADRRARYSPTRPRSPCSNGPPPPPTRSGSETPTPANSSDAEPTAQASPAPHRRAQPPHAAAITAPNRRRSMTTTFEHQTAGSLRTNDSGH